MTTVHRSAPEEGAVEPHGLPTPTAGTRRRRSLTVALVGADGAGKSTLAASLAGARLPAPVVTVYMGVNLEASGLMLPTTRLLLIAKRLRGRRADLVASRLTPAEAATARRSWARNAKDAARMVLWSSEEWFRAAVVRWHRARGRIVVLDRHFFADYYHTDVAGGTGRGPAARWHGWMLDRFYPRPDLVVCLDAPAEVLHERKQEATVEWLADRRRQYLALADVVPAFVAVDATRPAEAVLEDVVRTITDHWKAVRG